jgi:conjugative transfer signal peptidase TraF
LASLSSTLPNRSTSPHILGSHRVFTGADLVHPKTITLLHREGSRRIPAPASQDPRQHALARNGSQVSQAWRPHRLSHRRSRRMVARQYPSLHIGPRSVRGRIALLAALVFALLASPYLVSHWPLFVWNVTPSVPVGLYQIVRRSPRQGDLVLVALPERVRTLAAARQYLGPKSLLIKPVAAISGDRVCRLGSRVWISGHAGVTARAADALDRPLPTWRGCRILTSTHIFVLSRSRDSFDSRYFGPIHVRSVVGIAVPIWTVSSN